MSTAKPRPRLTRQQLDWLAAASFDNARRLLDESLILVKNGSLPRAGLLVETALEEYAKARLCERQDEVSGGRNAFWKAFYAHPMKLRELSGLLEGVVPDVVVDKLIEFRERSLYVQPHHDGRTLTPNGLVTAGGLDTTFLERWIGSTYPAVRRDLEAAAKRSVDRTARDRSRGMKR